MTSNRQLGSVDRDMIMQLCALSGISAHDATQHWADTRYASIVWSRLTEPGDSTAGALLAALGPQHALALVVDGADAQTIVAHAREAGHTLDPDAVARALQRFRPRLDARATATDIAQAHAAGLQVITPGDDCWPAGLRDLGLHAPLLLWVRGDPQLLTHPSISVVGARAATGYGTQVTAEIVDGLCQAGLAIVSGAAYGIDAVAHRAALAAEVPTIAVLAGGADRPYPIAHGTLLNRIAAHGVVCAEMIPGSAPTKWRFRMRNRVIAALSPATLVTEAGVHSGTLNTAGHAAELGRSLGAVPGPVTSAASAGCHLLIREYDASLVTNARDACELAGVNDMLALFRDVPDTGAAARMPPIHERVLDAIPLRGSRTLGEIARAAGLSEHDTRGALAELELLGHVVLRTRDVAAEPAWALVRAP